MGIFSHNFWIVSRSIVLVVACAYLGLSTLMYIFQSRLIYHPVHVITMTPENIGLTYENTTFKAEDGIELSGWFVPAEHSRGVVLFCHGNAGNITDRLESINIFHLLGLSVFIFDYRGYGESSGKTNEHGTYLDAEAAWNYLVEERHVTPEEIIIMGRSLGGAIAARLAKRHTPKVLILESAFTSIRAMGKELFPWLPLKFLSRFDYTTIDYISAIECPVLIIHSPDDDLIPYNHGRCLFEAAHEPKEFFEISGSHDDGFLMTGKLYEDGLDGFISKYLGK